MTLSTSLSNENSTLLTSDRLRIVIFTRGFEPGFRGGGPIRSLSEIIRTAPADVDIVTITRDRDEGVRTPYPGLSGRWVEFHGAKVFYLNTYSIAQWTSMLRVLRRHRPDVVYLNSFWDPLFTFAPLVALRTRIVGAGTILIAPRGELSKGALSLKRRKKSFFLRVWRPLLRSLRPVWHASAEGEAEQIRRIFPMADIHVGPDPSALPGRALDHGEPHDGPSRLVFVSRISPKKNLHAILLALQELSASIQFDIYGPKEDAAYWKSCEELIRRLPQRIAIKNCGTLSPDSVVETFNRYDAFVFPTLGENYGHVIAESLSASCPVICSDTTPWTPVLKSGGGSVLADGSIESLRDSIEQYAALSPIERVESKRQAGCAYEGWRSLPRDRHIFDQIRPFVACNEYP
jgi:glycosyltransferase involved in cell wall biosynthesis